MPGRRASWNSGFLPVSQSRIPPKWSAYPQPRSSANGPPLVPGSAASSSAADCVGSVDAQRYQQVKSILMDALDLPEAARDSFLTARCGADHELRREVASLLTNADDQEFLEPKAP